MIIPSLRSKRKARIEIIPLIDIVFFLLATFVMVSLSMVKNQGMPVNLPRASSGVRQTQNDPHTMITVMKNGEIFFNKKKVTWTELRSSLQELTHKTPDPRIILNGDEEATLGKAVSVLNEAHTLGIKKFSISTKQS